jgi:NADH-quinone oxidoreductase subunit E
MNAEIDVILDEYRRDPSQLVSILQDIQAEYNWLPKEVLIKVSADLGVALSRVYSVATYFRAFSLIPRGRHTVTVCMGTACHVRGSPRILDRAGELLGIKPGGITSDLKFSLETVNCLGCCALGPVIVVDGEAHGKLALAKVGEVLEACD